MYIWKFENDKKTLTKLHIEILYRDVIYSRLIKEFYHGVEQSFIIHYLLEMNLLKPAFQTIFGSAPPIMPNDKETKVEVLKPAPAGASAEPSNSSSGSAPLKLAQQAAAAPSAATGATQKTTNQQPTR